MSSEPSARHPASLLLLGCCCCEFYLTHVTTVQNPNFQATYKEAEEQHMAAIKQHITILCKNTIQPLDWFS